MEEQKEMKKPMPAGIPYLTCGGVFFILAMILPMYRMWALLMATAAAVITCIAMLAMHKKQVAAMPEVSPIRERAEELSKNLDAGRDELRRLKPQIQNPKVASIAGNMADTLERLADNLEKNPKDRNKIRKVAVHYVPMIIELVRNYINLSEQGVEGGNISETMTSIESGLEKVETSLKQYLDDMFEDDKLSIETDIAVLQQLMNKDAGSTNKMNFDDILKETNGGNEND